MQKIVVAVDSFKGSVGSMQVAESVERGIQSVFPACEVKKIAIADGGEGTVEALVASLNGQWVEVEVHDPLMRPILAKYGLLDDGATAILEMATASGLPLLQPQERNPLKTSTYGTGEIIADALKRGCRKLLIGIGGSATNDGGLGMLVSLGYRFFDGAGNELQGVGEDLIRVASIDDSNCIGGLSGVDIQVACDVTNPFSGREGAAFVYAPQKGADADMVEQLDRGLQHFASIIHIYNGTDVESIPGSGAAGGLGGGLAAFLHARLVSGIRLVLEAVRFSELVQGADLVITGEGKLDVQTARGKAPSGVLEAARKAGVPVIAIAGALEEADALAKQGFAGVFSIQPSPVTLEKAMETKFAEKNIERTIAQLMRLIKQLRS